MAELPQDPWRETEWPVKVLLVFMPFIATVLSVFSLDDAGPGFGPTAFAVAALASSLGIWIVTVRWAAGASDVAYPYWFFVGLAMGMISLSEFVQGRIEEPSSAASPVFLFSLVGFAIVTLGAGFMWVKSR